jgi:hypothetical protein
MLIKKFAPILILLVSAAYSFAQDPTSQTATAQQTPDPAQQQEEKLKLERKAMALLDQVVTEAQGLKLPENRVRVQITAADMLWDRSQARARGLFSDAASVLGQMMLDADRTDREEVQTLNQLRQELVLTAARHDADLAYQMLRSTQSVTANNSAGNGRRFPADPQNNLEQNLLATIAASDPKVAYQKANESLDKGEYPTALARVLAQLQSKDPEAFKKLSDKTLSRLGSDNLLGSREATSLAMSLLMPGPRVSASTSADANKSAANTAQVLNESAYHDLMDNAVAASLSVTSLGSGNNIRGGGGRGPFRAAQQNPQSTSQNPPDDTQVRQNNARMLLFGLSTMLPQIDQYLPERAPALRQKLADLGMGSNPMMTYGNQMRTAMQQGTSDSLEAAAKVAPPQIQSRLYEQAAQKAVDEGNTDRALQIANDHLDESGRNSIMQAVDFKRIATTASPEKLNDIKLKLAALPSDSDRVKYLLELASATQKDNPKLALRFLEDAHTLVNRRATNFKEFEDQLQVADAFALLDPKRSFDVLEPGIAQLNELLAAAQVLNGFEVDVFRDGELPLQGGSDLGNMVVRYGQELAALAKIDFERARTTADRFQLAEPRLLAKLSIVQVALGVQPIAIDNSNRRQRDFQFIVR